MIVVIVPFTALLASLLRYLGSQGICAQEWRQGTTQTTSVMLVAVENATSGAFIAYARKATDIGRLELMVFEEAHIIVKDVAWRQDMSGLRKLTDIDRRKLFLSGTLPPSYQTLLVSQFDLIRPATVRVSTARRNISYSVEVMEDGGFEQASLARVRELIPTVGPDARILVYPGSIAESERISSALGCHLYHSAYEDKQAELESWVADRRSPVMVATAALGSGISVDGVLLVVHINPYNSATDFVQESGRAGRRPEETARSISLISERDYERNKRKASTSDDLETKILASFAVTDGCRRIPIGQWMDGDGSCCDQLRAAKCDNCTVTLSGNLHSRPPSVNQPKPAHTANLSSSDPSPRTVGLSVPIVTPDPRRNNVISTSIAATVIDTQQGCKSLRMAFCYLKTRCPVCWLLQPSSDTRHPFASCRATAINLEAVVAFRRNLHWKDEICHPKCGVPTFICPGYGQLRCEYRDILLPFLLAAHGDPTYFSVLAEVIGHQVNEDELRAWMARSNQLFGKVVTNAVVAFDAVYRHRRDNMQG